MEVAARPAVGPMRAEYFEHMDAASPDPWGFATGGD